MTIKYYYKLIYTNLINHLLFIDLLLFLKIRLSLVSSIYYYVKYVILIIPKPNSAYINYILTIFNMCTTIL